MIDWPDAEHPEHDRPKKLIEVALPLKGGEHECARTDGEAVDHHDTSGKAQVLQWVARDLGDAVPGIESTPGVCGGEPRIVRTRITVWVLEQARRLGTGEAELLQAYPALRAEDLTKEVLQQARAEIRASWRRACADHADHPRAAELFDPERLPAFHDPFAGGGALPLEKRSGSAWRRTPATSTRWRC